MKTSYPLLNLLVLLLVLGGCSSSGVGLPQATGWAYEAVVVMSQKYWDNEMGQALREELEAPIPGLPQPESSLNLTEVTPPVFDGMLRYAKNIMQVNIDAARFTKVSLKHEINVWAQNQVVLTMNAPDEQTAIKYLKEKPGVLVEYFTKAEMDRAVRTFDKTYSSLVMEKVKAKFGVELRVPGEMTFYRDTTGFFWTSNNLNSGRTDMIVYSFPYEGPHIFTESYLVNKRDSVLRENIPGGFPNSYMATEVRFPIEYKAISHLGKYAGVMRGLWKMVGDMMGGPFVSLTRVDEENNQVIVVEAFVFAPETDKRNLMRRGEATLFTLRLPGEFDIPMSESFSGKSKEQNIAEDGK